MVPQLQPWVSEELAEILRTRGGIPDISRYAVPADDIVRDATAAAQAAKILEREGIVLVPGALDGATIQQLKDTFPELTAAIREHDPEDKGSRGEKRQSFFGGMISTSSQLHRPAFRNLVDVPGVTPVLEAYWGSMEFAVSAAGSDINLAGSRQHQELHSDISRSPLMGPSSKFRYSKAPMIAVNFLVEDQTPFNGPLQLIPGTQFLDAHYVLKVNEEPEHWLLSTMCPAPAGTAVIRDVRCWHAGTPNVTTTDRPLPNCEFLAPFVVADADTMKKHRISNPGSAQLSHADWQLLPERARHLTRLIRGTEGEKVEPHVVYKVLSFAETCDIAPLFRTLIVVNL